MSFCSKSLKNPTKAEQRRMSDIAHGVCLPCHLSGIETHYPQVNHLLKSGKRLGHWATDGECPWHHQGDFHEGWSRERMTKFYGPSRRHDLREFRRCYGTDIELIEKQNQLMGVE